MIYDVQRELLATKEARVLLAIDSYNEFFQPSMWHYGDDKVGFSSGVNNDNLK